MNDEFQQITRTLTLFANDCSEDSKRTCNRENRKKTTTDRVSSLKTNAEMIKIKTKTEILISSGTNTTYLATSDDIWDRLHT